MQATDKRYQFVKLCSALTKQGLHFTRAKGAGYALIFTKESGRRLLKANINMPFVNAIVRIAGDKKAECYQFDQWAGRY